MGSGGYSTVSSVDADTGATRYARSDVGRTAFYSSRSVGDTFTQREIHNSMDPKGVTLRESRDSDEHPNSVPIIIALDVTGSMGNIPHELVQQGLPNIMGGIIQKGIADPQVLFLGIGDHTCDHAPLQVGQFESGDELLDEWLTDVWLEGRGGGNDGESYMLAWYFAAMHTQHDAMDKRGKKGFLFTIGDEPVLNGLASRDIERIMGVGQHRNISSSELLVEAQKKYNVYHIHVKETGSGSRQRVIDDWRQLMSDNLLVVERHTEIAVLIADTVVGLSDFSTQEPAPILKEEEPEEVVL